MKKVCKECNVEKDLNEYPKHKGMKDGHINICKLCKKEYQKQWRGDNSDYHKEHMKQWKKDNKEHIKGYSKQYYKDNKETIKEYQKEYTNKFPEKTSAHYAVKLNNLKIDGYNAHHWSYNKEHWLDVIYLDRSNHQSLHALTEYDQSEFKYRIKETGKLLETKEETLKFIEDNDLKYEAVSIMSPNIK